MLVATDGVNLQTIHPPAMGRHWTMIGAAMTDLVGLGPKGLPSLQHLAPMPRPPPRRSPTKRSQSLRVERRDPDFFRLVLDEALVSGKKPSREYLWQRLAEVARP